MSYVIGIENKKDGKLSEYLVRFYVNIDTGESGVKLRRSLGNALKTDGLLTAQQLANRWS